MVVHILKSDDIILVNDYVYDGLQHSTFFML